MGPFRDPACRSYACLCLATSGYYSRGGRGGVGLLALASVSAINLVNVESKSESPSSLKPSCTTSTAKERVLFFIAFTVASH